MNNHHLLPVIILLLTGLCRAQDKSDELLMKVLRAEGITTVEEADHYREAFREILAGAEKETDPDDDAYDRNEDLFEYLQENCLKKFTQESRFTRLLDAEEYNGRRRGGRIHNRTNRSRGWI